MEQRESNLHITSKMSFLDRKFAYFKALLDLQQGNVSKILGPSFVSLVLVWLEEFWGSGWCLILIVLEPGVVERPFF